MCFFVQTCRDLKDRQQLLAYRSKVDKGSAEEEKIDAILSSSVTYPPGSLGEHAQGSSQCMLQDLGRCTELSHMDTRPTCGMEEQKYYF